MNLIPTERFVNFGILISSVVFILVMLVYFDVIKRDTKPSASTSKYERMTAYKRPAPLPMSTDAFKLHVKDATCIPSDLYLGLNYDGSSISPVATNMRMINILYSLYDQTSLQPEVGMPAKFVLRSLPDNEMLFKFGKIVMDSVSSPDGEKLTMVVQKADVDPKYVVYVFLDNGVKWGQDTAPFCSIDRDTCFKSDFYFSTTRKQTLPDSKVWC